MYNYTTTRALQEHRYPPARRKEPREAVAGPFPNPEPSVRPLATPRRRMRRVLALIGRALLISLLAVSSFACLEGVPPLVLADEVEVGDARIGPRPLHTSLSYDLAWHQPDLLHGQDLVPPRDSTLRWLEPFPD